MEYLILNKKDRLLTITLNRPDVRNAFNALLIEELTSAFSEASQDKSISVVHLKGEGKTFSAGADLNWMKKSVELSKEENIEDAKTLSNMLSAIKNCSKPVIASVQGAALGGGMGLVSSCDYIIAEEKTWFGFTEVKLGLIPAVISPFVLEKIGLSWSKALFMSGERFQAQKALQIGLIHEVVSDLNKLQKRSEIFIQNCLQNSPQAMGLCKKLISDIDSQEFSKQSQISAEYLAQARTSEDAKEGIQAFFEKRKPIW